MMSEEHGDVGKDVGTTEPSEPGVWACQLASNLC